MKTPLGWMLGIAAIIAATRFTVATAKDEPGEIVARRIVVKGAGDSSIELSADEKGCRIEMQRGKWGTVRVSLDEDGAKLWMTPTGPQDSPSVTVAASSDGASLTLSAADLTSGAPWASLMANRSVDTASLDVAAGPVTGNLRATRIEAMGLGSIAIGRTVSMGPNGEMPELVEIDGHVREPGFTVGYDTVDGTSLDVFDGNATAGLAIRSSGEGLDGGPEIALFGLKGKRVGGPPPGPSVPSYVPTSEAVRPPASAPADATPAVLKAWEEWRDAFGAADKAARLAVSLLKLGGGARDRSFLYALTNRDAALKACAVLKKRYEEAIRAGR